LHLKESEWRYGKKYATLEKEMNYMLKNYLKD